MMKDLEQAYRILELRAGATLKQVSEARKDLLALWNPKRLADHPRLRSKAPRKIEEINQAYDRLIEHLSRSGAPESGRDRPLTTEEASTAAATRQRRADGEAAASLYDEVYLPRKSKGGPRIQVWPMAGLFVLVIVVLVMLLSTGSEQETENPQSPAALQGLPSEPPQASATGPSGDVPDEGAPAEPTAAPQKKTKPKRTTAREAETDTARPIAPPPVAEPASGSTGLSTARTGVRSAPPSAKKPAVESRRPALIRESGAGEAVETKSDGEKARSQNLEKAYEALLANSSAARKLIAGEFRDFRFSEWRMAHQKDSEIWLDIIVQQKDDTTVHFVWSVQAETGITKPINAAAINLERNQ